MATSCQLFAQSIAERPFSGSSDFEVASEEFYYAFEAKLTEGVEFSFVVLQSKKEIRRQICAFCFLVA